MHSVCLGVASKAEFEKIANFEKSNSQHFKPPITYTLEHISTTQTKVPLKFNIMMFANLQFLSNYVII